MKNRELMSNGNPFKAVLVFSIPSILAMLVNSIYNIVDKIFIGNYVSDVALGGLQVVNPLTYFSFFSIVMFGLGSGSYASNKLGEHKDDEANKIFNNGLFMTVAVEFILSIFFLIFRKQLLLFAGATAENYEYAYTYYSVLIFGFVFQAMAYFFTMNMRSEGRPLYSMMAQVTGAVMNIAMDALFIIVFKWGAFGAALATVLSNVINFLIGFYFYVISRKHYFNINFKQMFHINWHYIEQVVFIGLSSALLNISSGIATIFYNNVIGDYDNALSILAILNAIDTICVMPCVGIRQGLVPLFGYNYGEKNYKRMFKVYLVGILYCSCYGLLMTFIIRTFPSFFVNLFINSSSAEIKSEAVRICGFYQLGLSIVGINLASSAFYQASRHKLQASLLSVMRQCLFLVPLIYLFNSLYSMNGVWYAQPISDGLASIFGAVMILITYFIYRKTGYISMRDYKLALKEEKC